MTNTTTRSEATTAQTQLWAYAAVCATNAAAKHAKAADAAREWATAAASVADGTWHGENIQAGVAEAALASARAARASRAAAREEQIARDALTAAIRGHIATS